jgi:hypothetical protein
MSQSSTDVMRGRRSLREEMAGGDLGDARLNARRDRLMTVLEQHPDAGFPAACADDAEVEALYRFLRNRRVSLQTVLAPHLLASAARCQALGDVLVIHDTTPVTVAREQTPSGLTRLGPRRHGFWVHAALAVSAEGLRAPLGLLSLDPFARQPPPSEGAQSHWRERFRDPTKESRRWAEGVTTVRDRCGDAVRAIHLMDREGDSDALFAELCAHGDRFVIRLAHDRRVETDAVPDANKLSDAIRRTECLTEREVERSPRRDTHQAKRSRLGHPPRPRRRATLQVTACRVTLPRPDGIGNTLPPGLSLHVVAVGEAAPPAGETPVEWRLMTTEPIDTVAQVLQIVDWYRTRWMIEEFFNCLKTGCADEQRQLESLDTFLVALALLAPVAWNLLLMRHLAREFPHANAAVALTGRQIALLRTTLAGQTLSITPSVRDALLVVARLGGHLRQNGEPGWLTLTRGMQKLRDMEAGWAAAEDARTM